jgi:serine/threonine-protein kinase SIK3
MKKRKTGMLKKYWIGMLNNDLFYFKNDTKNCFKRIQHLNGYFLITNEEYRFDDRKYHSFQIINRNDVTTFYHKSENKVLTWVGKINKNLNNRDIKDYYEIGNTIGTGSYGHVKLIHSKYSNDRYAVKCIDKTKLDNDNLLRIYREIEFLKICKHPNIIEYIDHFEDHNYFYIITEYLECHLGTFLTGNSILNETIIKQLFNQIAQGVNYLHNNSIIHRDLKYENILVNYSEGVLTVKLMDFGLSTFVTYNQKLTDGCGTLCFVAPEILLHEEHNYQVDIWSLGILLFYMLFGNLPFNGSLKKIKYDIINNEVKISKHVVSKDVYELLIRCLNKDPSKRITMKEIVCHNWVK